MHAIHMILPHGRSLSTKGLNYVWNHNFAPSLAIKVLSIYHKCRHGDDYYCPQQSCSKVIISQVSVSHSVYRGGVCLSACWDKHPLVGTPPLGRYTPPLGRYTPWPIHPLGRYTHPQAGTPPGQVHPLGRYTQPPGRYTPWQVYPPQRRSLQWTVRILLECFLVHYFNLCTLNFEKRSPYQLQNSATG